MMPPDGPVSGIDRTWPILPNGNAAAGRNARCTAGAGVSASASSQSALGKNRSTTQTVDTLVTERPAVQSHVEIRPPAQVTIEAGAAKPSEISIDRPRVNIGRTVEVYREGAGLARRDDVAFTEEDESAAASRANTRTSHVQSKPANAA